METKYCICCGRKLIAAPWFCSNECVIKMRDFWKKNNAEHWLNQLKRKTLNVS
jgi:hypothetical protein